ncbi:polyprenyl diphosphate synthase [Streptomyces sp. I05A-00742]|uniref:polyprenyl diphosphate synthase n=1 Tax=Streptomyces sp. I05A-00742 TaxID=2732853 RepID=UPI001488B807|nr:polyprenyl diphosphate synthase [Streptomyces sp. I05A-00742]
MTTSALSDTATLASISADATAGAVLAPPTAPRERVLSHLHFVPDGSRRWAKHHGLTVDEGHRAGADKIVESLIWCDQAGIPDVTYALMSTNNTTKRSKQEVTALFEIIENFIQRIAHNQRWRILLPGHQFAATHTERIHAMRQAADSTHHITERRVAILLTGTRSLLIQTVHDFVAQHPDQPLTEEAIATQATKEQPEMDLIIRTAGDQRLSDLCPWHAGYAELYFTPIKWPDFTRDNFEQALHFYRSQDARRGV